LELAKTAADMNLIQPQTELQLEGIDQARKTLPFAGKAERAQYRQAAKTAPVAGAAERAQYRQAAATAPVAGAAERAKYREQRRVVKQRAPVLRQYFEEAGNVDEGAWADLAAAGVAQQYGKAREGIRQQVARSGATPGGGRMAALHGDLTNEQAKATAGARTAARRSAKRERFSRLSDAVRGAV
jgi:hypothetical protein